MIRKDVLDAMEKIENLEIKLAKNEPMSIEELESLGLFYLVDKNLSALSDSRFDVFKFHHLYLIYASDFTFKSTFYKINPNKSSSEVVDYKELEKINNKEFNAEISMEIQNFRIKNELLIPIEQTEVDQDKKFLEKEVLRWAQICLDESHSDEYFKTISKETRHTLKKKNIEDYVGNTLDESTHQEVFIGLLKSYYIFYEAKKIIDTTLANKEPQKFNLNGVEIEFIFYSLIHILNRHYGQLISPQSISLTKSFHNTKIDPRRIHLFIDYVFKQIKNNGLEKSVAIESNKPILLNFHGQDYAIFPKYYKYDKRRIVVETFFNIEAGNLMAKRMIESIKSSRSHKLDDNLVIYITNIS